MINSAIIPPYIILRFPLITPSIKSINFKSLIKKTFPKYYNIFFATNKEKSHKDSFLNKIILFRQNSMYTTDMAITQSLQSYHPICDNEVL